MTRSRPVLATAAALGWFLAWRLLGPSGPVGTWVLHLGLAASALTAGAACARRVRRGTVAPRAWSLVGAAASVWGAGQLLWLLVVEVLGHPSVTPSPVDVGCLVAVPLLVVGLLSLPTAPTTAAGRRRVLLDGALVGVAVTLASWAVVLRSAVGMVTGSAPGTTTEAMASGAGGDLPAAPSPAPFIGPRAADLARAARSAVSEAMTTASGHAMDGMHAMTGMHALGGAGGREAMGGMGGMGGMSAMDPRLQLLFPLGDVLCATVAVHVLARARRGSRIPVRALVLLAGGAVAYALTDTLMTLLAALGRYGEGNPVDAGWFVGFLLVALAALEPETERTEGALEGTARVGAVAPYAAVVLGLGAVTAAGVLSGTTDRPAALGTAGLVALLLVRQVLALRENSALTDELESRVLDRTAELATRERRQAALLENLTDVLVVLDAEGRVTWASPSAARLGLSADALPGASLAAWWSSSDARAVTAALAEAPGPGAPSLLVGRVRSSDGRAVPVEALVTALDAGSELGAFLLTLRDVSERAALQDELTRQALRDELTGLANRTLFTDRLQHALVAAGRSGTSVSVLLLDLDGFKAVNDTLGHGAGDAVLREVASRLTAATRAGDTVARLGGDEFVVLLDGDAAGSEAEQVVRRLSTALLEPVVVDGRSLTTRASCGIAVSTGTETADDLVRNADLAMYAAKGRAAGTFVVFEPDMHAALVSRLALEDDLRGAVGRGEMELWYQPTMTLGDGRWSSCEALLRWQHPRRGMVSPLDFIPLAETSGLIVEIGTWVLREACRQTSLWRSTRPELAELGVAVNVSGRQLVEPGFLGLVVHALATSGLPASALVLELTESMLVDHDERLVALLVSLKDLGLRLAIDDFGTGYSSLSYLHRFPVDILKVDRSFVARMRPGSDEEELTRTIVQLGQSLGLTTVAEGIEEDGQLDSLQAMGCTHGQGYLFSRPVPGRDIDAGVVPRPLPGRPSVPAARSGAVDVPTG